MKTPEDKKIAFLFGSHPMKDPKQRWQARLSFPQGAGPESVLTLAITDGEETPVASGIFEFCGRQLEVTDGRASLTYAEFIAGLHETSLWLHRKGMPPVSGGLTFG